LYTIKTTSYKIKKVILSADIADMQTFILLLVIANIICYIYITMVGAKLTKKRTYRMLTL